jgi:hypothetical protein
MPGSFNVVADVLESPAVALLLGLEADGFQIGAAEGDRLWVKPISKLTEDRRADLERYRPELLMLLRICDEAVQLRRDRFREALASGTSVGLLTFRPGVPYAPGRCFSCGEGLDRPAHGKCWRCALAWRLALRLPIAPDVAAVYDSQKVLA